MLTVSSLACPSALKELSSITSDRFYSLVEVARKQSETVDASDLARLTKQFKLAKSNFLALDVQKELMGGKPSRTCPWPVEALHSK